MMKKVLVIFFVIAIAALAYVYSRSFLDGGAGRQSEEVTEESGASKEGSEVFSEDSSTHKETDSGGGFESGFFVTGRVVESPTCPVERQGEACEEGLQTSISIFDADGENEIETLKSNEKGEFEVILTNGTYTLSAKGGNPYPSCKSVTVTVPSASINNLVIECDTGIR